jgi:hypothetical protein
MSEFKFPTETIELPSKGFLYPKDNPLSSGKIEMKYMTAKEEDILTNQNYIKNGTVLDELLKSLIVSKVNLDDLLIGDKNSLLIAARILGYGKDYTFNYEGEEITIDLSKLNVKYLDESLTIEGKNEFSFILPNSDTSITFRLLTQKDDKLIEQEIKGLKKINKNSNPEISTRMKYIITSVNGEVDKKHIREFVDNYLLARDSRALRSYIKEIQPDIELKFPYLGSNGVEEDVNVPINTTFFWPDI